MVVSGVDARLDTLRADLDGALTHAPVLRATLACQRAQAALSLAQRERIRLAAEAVPHVSLRATTAALASAEAAVGEVCRLAAPAPAAARDGR
jgi:hypothetical protein